MAGFFRSGCFFGVVSFDPFSKPLPFSIVIRSFWIRFPFAGHVLFISLFYVVVGGYNFHPPSI